MSETVNTTFDFIANFREFASAFVSGTVHSTISIPRLTSTTNALVQALVQNDLAFLQDFNQWQPLVQHLSHSPLMFARQFGTPEAIHLVEQHIPIENLETERRNSEPYAFFNVQGTQTDPSPDNLFQCLEIALWNGPVPTAQRLMTAMKEGSPVRCTVEHDLLFAAMSGNNPTEMVKVVECVSHAVQNLHETRFRFSYGANKTCSVNLLHLAIILGLDLWTEMISSESVRRCNKAVIDAPIPELGLTPMHLCCLFGRHEILKNLLQYNPSYLPDKDNLYPACYAAKSQKACTLLKTLVEQFNSENVIHSVCGDGLTLLHFAVGLCNCPMTECLISEKYGLEKKSVQGLAEHIGFAPMKVILLLN